MLALTFVRPSELRLAKWPEFDLDAATWTIPKARMKMRRKKDVEDHLVPLSRQAVALLRELHTLTGSAIYVFPGLRPGRPLSENAFNVALRTMGYSGKQMTAHGFRAMARTILDQERHKRVDIIEHQMAHAVKDANGRAYNRTSFLPERIAMIQDWSDYLDGLRSGKDLPAGDNVTDFRKAARAR